MSLLYTLDAVDTITQNLVSFEVYESDSGYHILPLSPDCKKGEHLCHPSVRSFNDIKREILIVFQARIIE
ncbi:TPA: hypothetical protein PJH62_003415 [Acinetobacter nosocomialis]|uniref:hypothetical protein n=1 Tax=Acinetobacter calcoaceticus/baumannii complex TaxID=909768 RepID=UPI00046E0123|nr:MULTISPECIES: hypothetical protein [Acinetobacter calcoaceticus/baumannii complex]MBR7734998.1 hypothetical protein [Acinetobacter nosocomialis]MDE1665043.1 hypothetical protein [Acinetobacter nosocomialis]MDE9415008.1 hypothetical protein [Acinetobacter nosocomialis]HDH7780819.1 hypothetical protein [Acinetobacter nosocomialis]